MLTATLSAEPADAQAANLQVVGSIVAPTSGSDSFWADSDAVRPLDHIVLEILRRKPGLTVTSLLPLLEVTQTAVRARLDRLESFGLIERVKLPGGRGRPVYQYFLTNAGWRKVGVTYLDLATAVWSEIESLPDSDVKRQLLDGVAKRMGQAYARLLPNSSTADRMGAMAKLLTDRKIPTEFKDAVRSGDLTASEFTLPVLTVHACPFPDLAAVDRRSACELEQAVFSEAVGAPMELSCCRLDGHGTCQFKPVDSNMVAH